MLIKHIITIQFQFTCRQSANIVLAKALVVTSITSICWLVVAGIDRVRETTMDWLNLSNRTMVRVSNKWSTAIKSCRCSTSLIRPGIVRKPGREDEILTAAVGRVNIAPLGSCVVNTPAVSLNLAI